MEKYEKKKKKHHRNTTALCCAFPCFVIVVVVARSLSPPLSIILPLSAWLRKIGQHTAGEGSSYNMNSWISDVLAKYDARE
jgi:hypothetical protein